MLCYRKVKEGIIAVKSTEENIVYVVMARNGTWYYWGKIRLPVEQEHIHILNQINEYEESGCEYEMY